MVNYPNSPVKEAVIELRFSSKLDETRLESIGKLVRGTFDEVEMIYGESTDLSVGHSGLSSTRRQTLKGTKFSYSSGFKVKVLADRIVWSQLAPYRCWEDFDECMVAVWNLIKNDFSLKNMSRVGVRFINEIVIPSDGQGVINLFEYLTVLPRAPSSLDVKTTAFLTRLAFEHQEDNVSSLLTVNSGAKVKAGASVILDIDVYRQYLEGYTGTFVELNGILDTLREVKNRLFESCITDKARELFQ